MADDEKLQLRDLPPVPPIEVFNPRRFSQTLMSRADVCLRSAYLYLKWNGGPGSHAMDRGTVVHEGAERLMLLLIREGEKSMLEYAVHQGPGGALVREDIVQAENDLASMTKALVDEILEERHDLNPTSLEADAARAMLWHIALGLDVDPETVLGVERKFVLDLECGVTVSGKVDLLSTPDLGWVQVDDYKSSFNAPTEEEFERLHSFQTKLYAALAVFGVPVEKQACRRCEGLGYESSSDWEEDDGVARAIACTSCKGRGTVEVRLHDEWDMSAVRYARGRQLYPRPALRELPDGRREMVQREQVYTRTELADFLLDLNRIARRLLRGLETWKFPAIPGEHCSTCTARAECPLPSHLRRYAGLINEHAQAQEALAWLLTMKDRTAATEAEIKAWAKANGPILLGERLYGFTVRHTAPAFRQRKGRDMKAELVERAQHVAKYGGELDMSEFLRGPGTTNVFGDMGAPPEVVARMREEIARAGREPEPVDLDAEQPPGVGDPGADAGPAGGGA